ncbi:hypothetical protein GF314_05850 [bacterium]|nr:hypothetical protein [bacterium]
MLVLAHLAARVRRYRGPAGQSMVPGAVLIALLSSLTAPALAGQVFLGLSAVDLQLEIDDTLDLGGETRFFSSRHRMHAGGRFTVHLGGDDGQTFYVGQFLGFGWGQSSFLLNWETPGLESYAPLESDITWGYVPYGVDLNLVLGDVLHLAAFVSAKWTFQKLTIDIDGEEFDGRAHKLVGSLGGMATVNLGVVRVSGGASLDHYLGADVDWEVDDVTFASRHTDPSVEYFVGVVLR